MTEIPKYYWDACIFISYLKGEQRSEPGVTEAIKNNWKLMYDGKIVVFTSLLTKSEVLHYHIGEEPYKKFLEVFYSELIEVIPTDDRVWDIAYEIRNYYSDKKHGMGYVSVPDAVHLASGILAKADEFHTVDGRADKGLVRLDGKIADKYDLHICYPAETIKGSKVHLFSQ